MWAYSTSSGYNYMMLPCINYQNTMIVIGKLNPYITEVFTTQHHFGDVLIMVLQDNQNTS